MKRSCIYLILLLSSSYLYGMESEPKQIPALLDLACKVLIQQEAAVFQINKRNEKEGIEHVENLFIPCLTKKKSYPSACTCIFHKLPPELSVTLVECAIFFAVCNQDPEAAYFTSGIYKHLPSSAFFQQLFKPKESWQRMFIERLQRSIVHLEWADQKEILWKENPLIRAAAPLFGRLLPDGPDDPEFEIKMAKNCLLARLVVHSALFNQEDAAALRTCWQTIMPNIKKDENTVENNALVECSMKEVVDLIDAALKNPYKNEKSRFLSFKKAIDKNNLPLAEVWWLTGITPPNFLHSKERPARHAWIEKKLKSIALTSSKGIQLLVPSMQPNQFFKILNTAKNHVGYKELINAPGHMQGVQLSMFANAFLAQLQDNPYDELLRLLLPPITIALNNEHKRGTLLMDSIGALLLHPLADETVKNQVQLLPPLTLAKYMRYLFSYAHSYDDLPLADYHLTTMVKLLQEKIEKNDLVPAQDQPTIQEQLYDSFFRRGSQYIPTKKTVNDVLKIPIEYYPDELLTGLVFSQAWWELDAIVTANNYGSRSMALYQSGDQTLQHIIDQADAILEYAHGRTPIVIYQYLEKSRAIITQVRNCVSHEQQYRSGTILEDPPPATSDKSDSCVPEWVLYLLSYVRSKEHQ
jgi:hypothetical protein